MIFFYFSHLGEKLFGKSLSPKNPFSKTFFLKTFLKKGFQTFQKLFTSEPFSKKGSVPPKTFET
ncbi:MAG: hypothetical protein D6805_00500 [Planctomycetota bacterium]|nr:MAG: hypothetical protein D6805_00500 [Planctomycetota bacterium]